MLGAQAHTALNFPNMVFALFILVLLIFAAPATVILDNPIIRGLIVAAAAVSVAIVGFRMRPGEAGFLSRVIRPVTFIAALPAVWMLIQAMPLPNSWFAHPIWKSTASALGMPLAGSISIDPGATLLAFARYLSATAIAFVAAAVAIDRRRAEWVFYALIIATTVIALMALAVNFGSDLTTFDGAEPGRVAAAHCAALGVIFAAATAIHTSERGKALRPDQTRLWVWPLLVAWLASLSICLLAVISAGTGPTYFAVACGVATLVVTFMIQRFSIGPWGIAAIVSLALLVAIAAVAFQSGSGILDLTLAFAAHASPPLIRVTQRALAETGWAGTGAGTFAAVIPIYKDVELPATAYMAPTAAAAIAVEMGRPFFWAILITAIALALALLRGALWRQRDAFYSITGASCIVTITLLLFVNAAFLSTSVMLISAVAIGVAVAQSKSRYF
jgi:hypothetical protein